jgi:hypothetical protein
MYPEREVDLGEEVEGVVGEELEQRVERRLRAPWRHPPHQIHRRVHAPLAPSAPQLLSWIPQLSSPLCCRCVVVFLAPPWVSLLAS